MQAKVDFLRSIELFKNLKDHELVRLARNTREYAFEAGAVIAYQRDVAHTLYIVKEGRLDWFSMNREGEVLSSSRYMPGQYFRDVWLFAPGTHDATVRAARDGRLVVISGPDFVRFLTETPSAVPRIEPLLSPEARDELHRSSAESVTTGNYRTVRLMPDELVEFESRRTLWLLLYGISIPLALTIILPLGALFLLANTVGLQPLRPWLHIGVPAGFFFLPFVATIWRWYDWANDYLLITNKHLIHHEFELSTFRGNVLKIPLDQVQSVAVLKPHVIGPLLDVGTIKVTTAAATSALLFDFVQHPDGARAALERIRARESELSEARTQEQVRSSLESYFGVQSQVTRVDGEDEAAVDLTAQASAPPPRRRRSLAHLLGYRVEDRSGTITYRRHWFVLVRRARWVLLAFFATITGLVVGGSLFPAAVRELLIVGGGLLTVELLSFIYYFDDWRNDVFQLTPKSIIDIDRGALGLSTSRKEANLEDVQNVRVEKPTILANLLDYGDVYIDTAGASAEIRFEDIINPNQVLADIFQRRAIIRTSRSSAQAEVRRREIALMLDVFKQAVEQDVLPQRTPPRDLEADGGDDLQFEI